MRRNGPPANTKAVAGQDQMVVVRRSHPDFPVVLCQRCWKNPILTSVRFKQGTLPEQVEVIYPPVA